MGFRKERGTVDAIYALKTAIGEQIERRGKKAYLFFADLKGAFDSIDRQKIWEVMERKGVSKGLISAIKRLYEETGCKIVVNREVCGDFMTRKGVRQGCPLSAILF